MKRSLFAAVAVLLISLVACSGKAPVRTIEEFNAEKSFEKANKLIDGKEYNEARAVLLEIKNRDLSGKFSPLAQLRIADSYVREDEPELAVSEFRKFLDMYPDHRHASYAQYQIAMVYFNQIESPERGYGGAAQALAEFERLKRDFPRNPYRDLIEVRIEKCRNTIADYEFLVGEYYLKKGTYDAAIGRFEGLLNSYPDYKKLDKVFLNIGIAYKKVGQKEKSEEYLKRLMDIYPNSPHTAEAKKELAPLKSEKK